MPKVKAIVAKTGTWEGKPACLIQMANPPKKGQELTIKWGAQRSPEQNKMYWAFLDWCIKNGLEEQGHFFSEPLHANLKKHLIPKGVELILPGEEPSSADLNKVQFSEYFEMVQNFMVEFFGMDLSPFFEEHGERVA